MAAAAAAEHSTPPLLLPAWLQASSDVLRRMDEQEEEGLLPLELAALPVCAEKCMDGAIYYCVLGAWCVSWQRVPLAPFLAAWFLIPAGRRRALLQERMVFASELDTDAWQANMLGRDDADMLAAVPDDIARSPDFPDTHAFIEKGAVRCLAWWAQRHGWAVHAWARHIPLMSCGMPLASTACSLAANHGQTAMLRLLHKRGGCSLDVFTSHFAAGGGSLDCLAYLDKHGCPWNEGTCVSAVENGHLACLAYLHERGCPWDGGYCCYTAARWGRLDCLAYLHEHGCPWSLAFNTCNAAAEFGHVAVLQYLHDHGCPWSASATTNAAMFGQLVCLQYLHEHGCPWTAVACRVAARSGHLTCLRYLHEHGCPWDKTVCEEAGYYGHLPCLQYAHEHGCPWTVFARADTALSGHQYRQECAWYARACIWRRWRRVILCAACVACAACAMEQLLCAALRLAMR